jgi:hypothetical protein
LRPIQGSHDYIGEPTRASNRHTIRHTTEYVQRRDSGKSQARRSIPLDRQALHCAEIEKRLGEAVWRHGSIYYESTLTLAAMVSRDSATGLFVPKRRSDYGFRDVITLPSSFGIHRGQAYLTASSWGRARPPATTVEVGILQTRGWVMQEKYLARRTLHFLEGQMVWWCCEKILGQSGYDCNLGQSWRKSA